MQNTKVSHNKQGDQLSGKIPEFSESRELHENVRE